MPHSCATAPEVVFDTLEELKAHYHTDWHRYNLKRKVAGLPMLTQKMFDRVVNQTIALAAAAEEAEQKRGARRQGRQGGRGRQEDDDDDDEEESDSGSDWEEVSGGEAEEVLQQHEERRQRRQELERLRREKEEAEDEDDEEVEDAGDGEPGPDVSLADNGFELVVNNKVLGSRDLARYYRQKHRPDSSSTAVVCARADAGSRQLATTQQNGSALPSFKKPVTDQEARIQKTAQARQAKANLALGLSTNGPMFRGFRDA